jgi:hypothetical protein
MPSRLIIRYQAQGSASIDSRTSRRPILSNRRYFSSGNFFGSRQVKVIEPTHSELKTVHFCTFLVPRSGSQGRSGMPPDGFGNYLFDSPSKVG